ncbi:MAG: hypothetical protein GQE15_27955 [Archangiaceae bacterium]|nr:hypothetical protein [Archangiaceae bacterium]
MPALLSLLLLAADGVVCVPPVPRADGEPVMSVDASKVSASFRVRVDERPWQIVSRTERARFEGLDRKARHLVQIAIDSRTIESFRFSFEDKGSNSLRLVLKTGYFTWSLLPGTCP